MDRITFTGESATGRVIACAASANLVPVSLELGGKGANIVFDDAELGNAVDWSIRAIFSNAGQVCLAGSRLYVQRGIHDEFTDRFVAAAQTLAAGDPKDEATQLGPLASQEHYKKVRSYLDGIEADGGTIRTGGFGAGWVVLPTVVEDVPPTARICREEVFGPVVTVTPFDTDEEAVAQANDTRYGLNAMVFTENLSRAHRAAAALKAGTVWVNCFFIRDLRAPFGGVGDSGIGREGGTFQPRVLHRTQSRRHAGLSPPRVTLRQLIRQGRGPDPLHCGVGSVTARRVRAAAAPAASLRSIRPALPPRSATPCPPSNPSCRCHRSHPARQPCAR